MKIEGVIFGLAALIGGVYFLSRRATATTPNGLPPTITPVLTSGTSYVSPWEDLMPKGIRNHNPMNLRYYPSINWDGQIEPDADGYARFETVEMGIRAGVKNLVNGYFKRGINTPEAIIARYAPSHENPTDSYITYIADKMGIQSHEAIQLTHNNMMRLTEAIIHFENGSQPYQLSTIQTGVTLGMK